jgi:hypothetical protein
MRVGFEYRAQRRDDGRAFASADRKHSVTGIYTSALPGLEPVNRCLAPFALSFKCDTIDGKNTPFGLRPTKAFAAETSCWAVGWSASAHYRTSELYRRISERRIFGERLLCANIVEKVLLGRRTKILMTTEAFFSLRREGPYRFSEKRPRSFVSALEKIAAAETSNNLHLRDFWGRSIFDFFNNIRQQRSFHNPSFRESESGRGHGFAPEHYHEALNLPGRILRSKRLERAGHVFSLAKCILRTHGQELRFAR